MEILSKAPLFRGLTEWPLPRHVWFFFCSNMINKFKSEHSKQLGLSVGHGSTLTRTSRSGVFFNWSQSEHRWEKHWECLSSIFIRIGPNAVRRLKDRIRDYSSLVHFYGSSLQSDRWKPLDHLIFYGSCEPAGFNWTGLSFIWAPN